MPEVTAATSVSSGALELIITILCILLAITATVLAHVFIIPESRKPRLNRFGKFLHDTFNFKYLAIEKILRALYVFSTAYVLLYGFTLLFQVQETYTYDYSMGLYVESSEWVGWAGLLVMILGPIAVRLGYEAAMMLILLVKNVIAINNKMKNMNEESSAPVAPAAPVIKRCPQCGATVNGNTQFCIQCGTQIN